MEGRYRFVVRCRRRPVIHGSKRTARDESTACRRDSRTVPPVAFSASSGAPARAVTGVAPNRVGKRRTYAPIVHRRKDVSDRFLSEPARLLIADGLDIWIGIRVIAETIGRSASTVSREIRRHRDAVSRRHPPDGAYRQAIARVAKADPSLPVALIPDDAEMRASHETIYQAVHLPSRGDLEPRPARVLCSGRSRRHPQQRLDRRFTRFVEPMTMIAERPVEIGERLVAGCVGGGPLMVERTARRPPRSATARGSSSSLSIFSTAVTPSRSRRR